MSISQTFSEHASQASKHSKHRRMAHWAKSWSSRVCILMRRTECITHAGREGGREKRGDRTELKRVRNNRDQ